MILQNTKMYYVGGKSVLISVRQALSVVHSLVLLLRQFFMSTRKLLFADTVQSTILQFTNAVPKRQLLWRVSQAGSRKHSCSHSCTNVRAYAANYERTHSNKPRVIPGQYEKTPQFKVHIFAKIYGANKYICS
jgi:hypothetical protein